MDREKISLRSAVYVSYISPSEQQELAAVLRKNSKSLDMKAAKELRNLSESGELTPELMEKIVLGEKKVEEKLKNKPAPIRLKPTVYQRFFAPDTSKKEIEKTIEQALEMYFQEKGE